MGFQKDLRELINKYSIENESDTPDFILAQFICDTLRAFESTTKEREKWYGRKPKKLSTRSLEHDTTGKEKSE